MNCDRARDLFFDEQDHLLSTARQVSLRGHLSTCAACAAERAVVAEASTTLAEGLRAMTAGIGPSPSFRHTLNAALDAVDAERATAPAPIRPVFASRPSRLSRLLTRPVRRWAGAVALLAALLAGLIATGNLQQAWAGLRQRLYFLPLVGVGQVEQTALVATAPGSAGNGSLTLTVTDLVAGRQTTLLRYRLSGAALATPSGNATVADAVDATLIGAHGRRYLATYTFAVSRGSYQGVPAVSGSLAFQPLARDEGSVRLIAAQLPLAPRGRPWSLHIALRPVGASAARTSLPLDSSAVHQGIRLTVTDLTRAGQATVVDMASRIESGPFAGGIVDSLSPENAVGDFAPVLSTAPGAGLRSLLAPLPAPVRLAALPRPEFIFAPLRITQGQITLTVPAVAIRGSATVHLRVAVQATRARVARLGGFAITIRGQVVVPPAALGLGDERRLRLTLAFPRGDLDGTLQSVSVIVDGVSRTVSRDDARVDLPLLAGQKDVRVTLADPRIVVHGPWVIGMRQ